MDNYDNETKHQIQFQQKLITHQKNKSNRQKSSNTKQVINYNTDLTNPTSKKISQTDKNLQIETKRKVIRIPILVLDNHDNETKHQIQSQQKLITNQKKSQTDKNLQIPNRLLVILQT